MTRNFRSQRLTRRHISDAGCFASDGEPDALQVIELSGNRGRNGMDGTSYVRPAGGVGVDGRRGGDATPAHSGQDAGLINAVLSYGDGSRSTGEMIVTANVSAPLAVGGASHNPQRTVSTLPIGSSGYLFIRAVGGRGGNGGRGGDGQPGSRGRKGMDATRFSRGGNGGPGGNGGDAGNPSDGAAGGEGGQVALNVNENDQGLLMLVKGDLSGGDIGFAGKRGRGGKGGAGGPGGSSYHWTETETYHDSDGNTQTRTRFHSNPGGFAGRNGRVGRPSLYHAKDGTPGEPGILQIVVVGPDGAREYPSPYDLQLITFDVASEHAILEPDSLVSVDKLVVQNHGGMPTPPNYTIRFLLDTDRWVLPDGCDLVLPKVLEPGETYCFEDRGIRFRIGDFVIDQPRRRAFSLRHTISPQARMESAICRPFRQFANGEEVKIRFPIELSPIRSLNSLAPGESTRMIWSVTNVGSETLDHKYLCRAVQSHLRILGGDIALKHIMFFDQEDQPHDLASSALQHKVRDLGPGESKTIETRIGIADSPDVVPYHGIAVGVDLDLQRPQSSDRREQYRRVDYRKTFIRVSERYQRQQGSRFLLVANRHTDVKDIEQWTQIADYFGSSLDVWDVSYYGFFDLVRHVDRDQSLLQQWRGMTIIVPNNYYETPAGRTVAFRQLAKSQFLKAAADHDINFYVVGDSKTGGAGLLQTALIPVSSEKSKSQLATQKDFLREVKRWNKYIAKSREVVGGASKEVREFAESSLGAVHELDISKRTLLFQPKRKWLEVEARRLQRKLRKSDPLHRWVIVHRYDTGDTDTSWGFFRKRKVGKLELRRTLDATKGSAVLYEVDAINMVGDDFIPSKENKHGIFLALKFEDKVDRFVRLVSERTFPRYSEQFIDRALTDEEIAEIGAELVDSMLVDLFNEQRVARQSKVWGRGGVEALLPKLNYLAERSLNYGLTYRQMQENPASMKLLYELLANLRYIARQSKSIWDVAIFPTAFFKRSRAVSAHMLDRVERIVTSIFGRELSWWNRASDADDDYDPFGSARTTKAKGLARTTANQQLYDFEQRLNREHKSFDHYTTAQDHPGLTYDPELLSESERVIPAHVYDQIVAAEQMEDKYRQQTEQSVANKRTKLLVPLRQATAIPVPTRTVSVQTTK